MKRLATRAVLLGSFRCLMPANQTSGLDLLTCNFLLCSGILVLTLGRAQKWIAAEVKGSKLMATRKHGRMATANRSNYLRNLRGDTSAQTSNLGHRPLLE